MLLQALQLLIPLIFFGLRRRNSEGSKENGQKLVKGNVDIEEGLTNTIPCRIRITEVAVHLPQLKSLRISTSSLWVKGIVEFPCVLSVKQLELFIGIHFGFNLVKVIALSPFASLSLFAEAKCGDALPFGL
ncbi:hypothetical protein RHMOL_Rhmol12G0163500 [Rhododendron molle]|uniref:Uncharacterized protein n=1 Tax=Rhododendron molle TaxID=49168 RepID=A0ACC0LK04_RHOML|nr:hypothetical protein RHMOL_Rhmol12G0163500 [Rhododendron molle]